MMSLEKCLVYLVCIFILQIIFNVIAFVCLDSLVLMAQVPLEENFEERVQLVLEKMTVDSHVRKSKHHRAKSSDSDDKKLKDTAKKTGKSADQSADQTNDCGFDLFESNQSRGQAKGLKFEAQRDEMLIEVYAKICGLDEDWFSIEFKQGEIIEFYLKNTSSVRFQSIESFAPRGRQAIKVQAIKSADTTIQNLVRFHVRKSGKYKVRIRLSSMPENEMNLEYDYQFVIKRISQPIKS
jgi:hypothetical protein